ncbi:RNA polymerase sigma factor [Aeromicrobium sp.]|uniref:RNA polymerase sigma factor n=1 Tax=Aeromicrobium sp. TaxID=1871063 RepID=UPI002FC795E7
MNEAGRAAAIEVACALADAMADQRLRIVASLIRTTGDWDLAEDAVSDAAERALQSWPRDGIPDNPAAWLTATARRRAIDVLRRAQVERGKLAGLAAFEEVTEMDTDLSPMDDDRLRLIFTCCHPALPLEARVALTLKVVSGLSTEAIGRSFLTSEATMGQRLLRAKNKIANAGIPYRVPSHDVLPERIDGVLAVVYLVFTEGYATASRSLADEAIRLGRLLVALMPRSDETRALLALLLLQHARRDAREADGERVTLEHQDRSRWHRREIDEAFKLLRHPWTVRGPYAVQADIAAVHASATSAEATNWPAIVALYDELLDIAPSPVIALNRAIAIGMSDGALAGLAALETAADDPRLANHYLVAAARGDMLSRAGLPHEALIAIEQAIQLAPTEQERRQLEQRAAELRQP